MSTLVGNLNSEYLGASCSLYSKNAPERVYVYVESYDDIPFWRSVFTDFENDTLCFEIMVPSSTSLVKGKKKVLDLIPSSGKNLILCVDSDYDYLLQDTTDTSKKVNQEKYVFQTYTYSIENYYCLAEHLHQACVKAVLCDRKLINWCHFFQTYSTIVYELFLWSVSFYKIQQESCFSINNFCSIIRLPENLDLLKMEDAFQMLENKIASEISRLEQIYPEQCSVKDALGEQLKTLGVCKENAYLFIHGHTIMDHVLLKIIIPLCNKLKRENLESIKLLAKDDEDKRNNLNYYNREISKVEDILTSTTAYRTSDLFQKIQNDICNYIKE